MSACPSIPSLVATGLLVATAFAVEAASGFGSTVVALALGGLWWRLDALTAIVLPLNLVVSLVLGLRDRAWIRWDLVRRRLLPGVGVGMAVGLAVSGCLSDSTLKVVYGGTLTVLAASQLARGPEPKTANPWPWLVVGGVAQGAFAASGPAIVYAMNGMELGKRSLRATLAVLWLVANVLLLGGPRLRPLVTSASMELSLALGPAALAGMAVGQVIHRRVSGDAFRKMTLVGVAGAATALMVSAVLAG